MRIGIVLSKIPGYSETFFRSKVAGLITKGHEVYIFVNDKNKIREFYGARVVESLPVINNKLFMVFILIWHLGIFFLKFPKVCIKYYKIKKHDNISLFSSLKNIYLNIHILQNKLDWLHFGFGTLAIDKEDVAIAIGAKMAISFRGFDIAIYSLKHKGCYNKTWKRVQKIHTISEDLRTKIYAAGLNKDKPVIKITPAIDVKRFDIKRDIQGKDDDLINIITIGRLTWKKGYEYALESLAVLKKRGLKFKYTIIGEGDEYERLKFAIYQLNLTDEVEFLGVLPHKSIVNQLKVAEVYLQPSVQEGFCNAVLEAQAAGCLCIVSDAEGLPENVLNGVTGWVVPRRDIEELANRIEWVINLKADKKLEIIENAQKRVKEEFNIDRQISKFIEFYES